MPAYFDSKSESRFGPTDVVGGGWNPDEQHIAPAIGLIAHAVETDRDRRRGDDQLRVIPLSCDILGVLPLEPVDLAVTVLRPGRTIALVEARLDHAGRTAVIARAWLSRSCGTEQYAGSALTQIASPDPVWDAVTLWPDGFVASLDVRRMATGPGRGAYWVRTDLDQTGPFGAVAQTLTVRPRTA
ncbi:MAG: thioesterase family protein [Actinomyces sp.]|jgi:hypothetical protein|nr:acyl-CoA thioesterase domain-containing protein [Actinomyces sp.]MCI1641899.1 thioesterase family protein [Actinomyces sp.]MCI1661912.1 thioesterase family protein [Actinomyces sp.]MCI1691256.1 thioesterase family protein [Actinomyces sp.]MCI1787715.1 thioesterase family protein [Actinomyces sp.]MCI1830378.1 thioesterase family protein [Actinomyces sp.]